MTLWEYSYISIYHLRKKIGCRSLDEPFMSLLSFIILDWIGWMSMNLIVFLIIFPKFGLSNLKDYMGLVYVIGMLCLIIIDYIVLYRRFLYLHNKYLYLSKKSIRNFISICYYIMIITIYILVIIYYRNNMIIL